VVKTRVHDLAAEFDIQPEQLITLLRDMDIFVRSHLSALEGDQVAAVRVRWEREKRKSAEEAQPKRGRRKAKAAESAPAEAAKPVRRRRTAAEVAEVEALAQAEREEAERDGIELEIERPILEPDEP
jgi:translation initiation factor IF-2